MNSGLVDSYGSLGEPGIIGVAGLLLGTGIVVWLAVRLAKHNRGDSA